jgi:site-specific recombinase XerD
VKSVKKIVSQDYLIWIEKDAYYKNDIWKLDEHRYYKLLTKGQQKKLTGTKSLDFSICNNNLIKNEIKNACAYIIEFKVAKLHIVFHDKFIIDQTIKFFNEVSNKQTSILDFENDDIMLDYEKYLENKGIATRAIIKRISANMNIKEYNERNKNTNFIRRIYEINKAATLYNLREQDKDVWDIRNLDINITGFNSARPRYTVSFLKIYQEKIRDVTKKYEYERLKNSKFSTIIDDLKAINLFSKFLYDKYPEIESLDKLTRKVVLEFLGYVESLDMTHTTKGQRKGCLRVFLNLIVMYGWDYTPSERLLHKSDYGKRVTQLPKPISINLIKKLNENIKYLPRDIARMAIVIQNVGMRVNELCRLKVGSVKKDLEGDYFLEYYQSKTDQYSRIPIKKEVAEIILEQEKEVLSKFKKTKYIFTRDGERPIGQESFSYHINRIAFQRDIRDENGKLYRFKSHHFRHTVATKYVNNGMNPNMIRIMLGHLQMKSIMSYIELRDSAVIQAMEDVLKEQNKIIENLNSDFIVDPTREIDLIHGKCIRSNGSRPCEQINKCYDCSMFYFCNDDTENFKEYLNRIEDNIKYAKVNGFDRMLEINQSIKSDIEKLIKRA